MSPRPRKKSGLLLTMGILCIVFGCLGLLCGGCGIFGGAMVSTVAKMPGPNPGASMIDHLNREVPNWVAIDIARATVVLLFSVLAIVAGIGLIARKGWGRWLAVVYAIVLIAQQIAYGIYQFSTFMPAMERWQKTQPPGAGVFGGGPGQQVGGVFGMILVVLFPVILLVIMLLPVTGAALRPVTRRIDDDDDLDDDRRTNDDGDDHDDRPRRRRPTDDDDRDPPRGRPDDARFRRRDDD